MGALSVEQLSKFGFGSIGENVLISDKASIYNPKKIHLGNNVRIDDFTILSAGEEGIFLGNNVHIACYVSIIGAAKIQIGNFSGISARTSIYSSNDDYSGNSLTGPTIPMRFRTVTTTPVLIGQHVIVGVNSVILPGVSIGDGVSIGAMSLVKINCNPWGVYFGIPAQFIKERSKELLKLEENYIKSKNG
ncbi:MAG: acyltransferase [Bacteroidota bacterium]